MNESRERNAVERPDHLAFIHNFRLAGVLAIAEILWYRVAYHRHAVPVFLYNITHEKIRLHLYFL